MLKFHWHRKTRLSRWWDIKLIWKLVERLLFVVQTVIGNLWHEWSEREILRFEVRRKSRVTKSRWRLHFRKHRFSMLLGYAFCLIRKSSEVHNRRITLHAKIGWKRRMKVFRMEFHFGGNRIWKVYVATNAFKQSYSKSIFDQNGTLNDEILFRIFNLLSRAEYLPIVCRRLLLNRKLVKYTYGYLTSLETRFARKRSLRRDISILGCLLISNLGIFLAVLASRTKVTIQWCCRKHADFYCTSRNSILIVAITFVAVHVSGITV